MVAILVPFVCLLSLLFTTLAQQAQSSLPPAPVQEFAFARAGSKLYIQGGKFVTNNTLVNITGQMFALDLSTSWPVTSAPWQSLSPGTATNLFTAVATPDNQTLIMFINGVNGSILIPRYDIPSNTWSPTPMTLTPDNDYRSGIRPVIDPTTWLVYLDAWTNLDIFNPNTSSFTLDPMPTYTFRSRLFSGALYNKPRKSLMYFGGLNGSILFDPQATQVSEYFISNSTWNNFTTMGSPPVPRSDFCMTESEDGNTIVVYGGRTAPNMTQNPPTNYTGTFYTLNVPTGQWTQGPDGDVRLYMGCLVVGDQFLAWGGNDGISTHKGPPVVFSLTTRQWITTYTAPLYYLDAPKTSGISGIGSQPTGTAPQGSPVPEATSSSSSNLGPILGGVFGALLVIALSGIIYLYLKRREDRARYGAPPNQQEAAAVNRDKPGDGPVSVLQYQQSNDSHLRNPQKPYPEGTLLRDPQDVSGLGYRSPHPQPIFTSPIDSELQYSVSRKDAVLSVLPSPSFANNLPQPAASPVVYVPKTSYSLVSRAGPVPFTPTQQTFPTGGPNNDVYRAYNVASPAVSQDINTFNNTGAMAYLSTLGLPYGHNSAPVYAASNPVATTTPPKVDTTGAGYTSYLQSVPDTRSTSFVHQGYTTPVTAMAPIITTVAAAGQVHAAGISPVAQYSPPINQNISNGNNNSNVDRSSYVAGQSSNSLTRSSNVRRYSSNLPDYGHNSNGRTLTGNYDNGAFSTSPPTPLATTPPLTMSHSGSFSESVGSQSPPSLASLPQRPIQNKNMHYTAVVPGFPSDRDRTSAVHVATPAEFGDQHGQVE